MKTKVSILKTERYIRIKKNRNLRNFEDFNSVIGLNAIKVKGKLTHAQKVDLKKSGKIIDVASFIHPDDGRLDTILILENKIRLPIKSVFIYSGNLYEALGDSIISNTEFITKHRRNCNFGQYVVCAAMYMEDGSVVTGVRHFSPEMRKTLHKIYGGGYHRKVKEQGFVDQFGNFLTRQEAYNIAIKNNQIRRKNVPMNGRLFSEHLY